MKVILTNLGNKMPCYITRIIECTIFHYNAETKSLMLSDENMNIVAFIYTHDWQIIEVIDNDGDKHLIKSEL